MMRMMGRRSLRRRRARARVRRRSRRDEGWLARGLAALLEDWKIRIDVENMIMDIGIVSISPPGASAEE
jgi:hypothetical protein